LKKSTRKKWLKKGKIRKNKGKIMDKEIVEDK
jgi:hypothetical protein